MLLEPTAHSRNVAAESRTRKQLLLEDNRPVQQHCLFAVLQLTRKRTLSVGKARCSHKAGQDSEGLTPPGQFLWAREAALASHKTHWIQTGSIKKEGEQSCSCMFA